MQQAGTPADQVSGQLSASQRQPASIPPAKRQLPELSASSTSNTLLIASHGALDYPFCPALNMDAAQIIESAKTFRWPPGGGKFENRPQRVHIKLYTKQNEMYAENKSGFMQNEIRKISVFFSNKGTFKIFIRQKFQSWSSS
jgi:hypothetical protein